jgi:hypothetical protein
MATADEIDWAEKDEQDSNRNIQKIHNFTARPDYKDATAIRGIIEFMEPGDGILDRLTPAEWAELRRRLTA